MREWADLSRFPSSQARLVKISFRSQKNWSDFLREWTHLVYNSFRNRQDWTNVLRKWAVSVRLYDGVSFLESGKIGKVWSTILRE